MGDTSEKAAAPKSPAVAALKALAGRWVAEIRWSAKTHKLVGGPATVRAPVSFNWIEDDCFLVQHMGGESPPAARWIIGRDDTTGAFATLYADTRGVCRIYQMSLTHGVWRIWRDAPGFHQRFLGRFSPDLNTIEALWEKSADGSAWENDFDVTFTRVR